MKKKKTNLGISSKDGNRLKSIQNAYNNLSEAAKLKFVKSTYDTQSFYKQKSTWSIEEKTVLRLMWNKCSHDTITDVFQCAYTSMLAQATALGLYPQLEEGRPLDEVDGELMLDLLKEGVSPKEVASKFNIEYDYFETLAISREQDALLDKMKQQYLFEE